MAQTVDLRVEIPADLWHSLVGEINQLPQEEQTRLQANPYPHSRDAQYVLENFLIRRRNIPELLGEDVEVTDRGEVIVASENGLLG